MAESVDDVNDQCSDISADSEVKNTKIYKFFKCCTKKTCSTLICKNCGGAYHDSCARKLVNKTGLSFLDATYVKCCEMEELIYNSNGGRENEIESNQSVNIRLKEENIKMRYEKQILQAEINHLKYLLNEQKENKERLLNEMNDKNLILRENNRFLMERITQMQTEIPIVNINSSQEKNRPTINIEKRENISLSKTPIILKDDKPDNQMSRNRLKNVTYSSIMSTTPIQQVSTSSLQASRKDTSNDSRQYKDARSNINKQEIVEDKPESQIQEKEFKKVTYKKRRPKKNLGTAEISEDETKNGFSGGERKVWLYIYRVNRVTTEKEIIEYITNKPGFDKYTTNVEEIPSGEDQLKRFLVTAPLIKKDIMYQPEFWPKNVGVKRFDFEKNKKFLSERSGNFQKSIQES